VLPERKNFDLNGFCIKFFKKVKIFDERHESIDKNIVNYLHYFPLLSTFDRALMMKSKTSKVAMKPPVIKKLGAFINSPRIYCVKKKI
jgi:hypothetical protein